MDVMGNQTGGQAPESVNNPLPSRPPVSYGEKDPKTHTGFVDVYGENPYTFLDHAYFGTGGFLDNSYLVPYPAEVYYNYRRKFTHYVNFFAAVTDAMVTPCFATLPKRLVKGSTYAEEFFKNCDGQGTSLTDFVEIAATQLRRHSIVYVCVDNVSGDSMPATAVEAKEQRAYPYVYLRSHGDVHTFTLGKFGQLTEIVFRDGTVEDDKKTARQAYRRINAREQVRFYLNSENKEVVIDGPTASPGTLPVVAVRIGKPKTAVDFVPVPRLFDLARVCHAIYNKDSEMRELERKQEFAILTYPGSSSDVSVGAGSMLGYPADASHAPGFIAPPAETLLGLLETRKELREDLYRVAGQNGVTGRATSNVKSGVAYLMEFQAQKFVLNQTGNMCETIEAGIMRVFFAFTNERSAEFSTAYHRAFTAMEDAAENELDEVLLAMEIPEKFRRDIIADLYRKRFPEATEDDINKLLADLDAEAVDLAHMTPGANDGPAGE